MSVEWHPKGWWDWCMSEDEKKKKIHFLLKSAKSYQNDFIACQQYIQNGSIRTFWYMKT